MIPYDCTAPLCWYSATTTHGRSTHVGMCHKRCSFKWLSAREELNENEKVTFTSNKMSQHPQFSQLKRHRFELGSDTLEQGSVAVGLLAKPMDAPANVNMFHSNALASSPARLTPDQEKQSKKRLLESQNDLYQEHGTTRVRQPELRGSSTERCEGRKTNANESDALSDRLCEEFINIQDVLTASQANAFYKVLF